MNKKGYITVYTIFVVSTIILLFISYSGYLLYTSKTLNNQIYFTKEYYEDKSIIQRVSNLFSHDISFGEGNIYISDFNKTITITETNENSVPNTESSFFYGEQNKIINFTVYNEPGASILIRREDADPLAQNTLMVEYYNPKGQMIYSTTFSLTDHGSQRNIILPNEIVNNTTVLDKQYGEYEIRIYSMLHISYVLNYTRVISRDIQVSYDGKIFNFRISNNLELGNCIDYLGGEFN